MRPDLAGLLIAAALTLAAAAAGVTEFYAIDSGASANPPNASQASGIGHFFLDDAQAVLTYDIRFDPAVTQEALAHIRIAAIANNGVDRGAIKALYRNAGL